MIQTCEKTETVSVCTFALIRIDYDFTLVKLASPVELNDHVAPACFPDESDNLEETFPPEMTCIVSGWGAIDPEWVVRGRDSLGSAADWLGSQMDHSDWLRS